MATISLTVEEHGDKQSGTLAQAISATDAKQLTRREFMSYAWGAALSVLALEVGVVSYFFIKPRFRAGEFGGKFFVAEADLPAPNAAPVKYRDGKFWLVNTAEGPKALYMLCTHLHCFYQWVSTNQRFECPCHGAKFSYAGDYIEGPAPRSLDTFAVSRRDGQVVIDTSKVILGGPSADSPAHG